MMILGEYEFRHYPSPGQVWDSIDCWRLVGTYEKRKSIR